MFAVTIENNVSKVRTVMTVFAESERDAHDQVALNGWTVVEIDRLKAKEPKRFDLSADSVNSVTPNRVKIEPSFGGGSAGDPALKSGKDGTEDVTGYPPIARAGEENAAGAGGGALSGDKSFPGGGYGGASGNSSAAGRPGMADSGTGGFEAADNLDLLPDSPDLEFMAEYHFELGNVEPIRNPAGDSRLDGLNKNGYYVVFGHADEVPVGGNAPYGSNFELSFKRARYIKDIMVAAGVPADNIRAVGLGTSYPAVRDNGKGNIANRRAEIYGFKNTAAGR